MKLLEDTWLMVLSQSTGAVDLSKEIESMRKRIAKSQYAGVFRAANITEEDLGNTIRGAIEKAGRKIKSEKVQTDNRPHPGEELEL